LKGRSYSRTDNTGTGSIKAAKYSIALQYLVFDGLVNDQVEQKSTSSTSRTD